MQQNSNVVTASDIRLQETDGVAPQTARLPTALPLPPTQLVGISGTYGCADTVNFRPRIALDLRIDVDSRYANSPVLDRVSGDFFDVAWIFPGGDPSQAYPIKIYRDSWIIDNP